jgi:hypothetical protein
MDIACISTADSRCSDRAGLHFAVDDTKVKLGIPSCDTPAQALRLLIKCCVAAQQQIANVTI